MSQPQDPPGPSREPSGDPTRGSKCWAPAWSGPELKTLLELWGEEEALQALKSRQQNADIFGRMAEALAQRGHYPRTQDQVRSKVKELRQGYVKAREDSSRSGAAPHSCPYYSELDQILGGGEARTSRRLVQSGLADPVVDAPEQDPEQSGDGDMVPEEDSEETATLTLEPVTQTPEASQVSSDAGDEAAAGPAMQEGRSTPAPPPSPSRGHGSHRHRCVYADIMRKHVEVVKELNTILRERAEAEDWWHDRLMEELVQQRMSLSATLREVCGLPAPVPGPAPPAPHDPAPPNPPSTAASLPPHGPPSPPAPPVLQPLSPPGPPLPQASQSQEQLPSVVQTTDSRPTQFHGYGGPRTRGPSRRLRAGKHRAT
ncbi:uncharacterized protein LOC142830418 [Pelodiscus sinensis]|uniref:uncharacterized protein LOC142830418 n=1 Tax=Pelodiscus sinensis TaxID=13735 RepID=UPI003F6C892F